MAQYVEDHLKATDTYPDSPNGSVLGITAISSVNGRIAAMVPHLERVSVRWATHGIQKISLKMAHGL